MSLIPYSPPPFPAPITFVQGVLNLLWHRSAPPSRKEEITARIQTVHKESRRLQSQVDSLELKWKAKTIEREKGALEYTTKFSLAQVALSETFNNLALLKSGVEQAVKELETPNPRTTYELNKQSLNMLACVASIEVFVPPLFSSKPENSLKKLDDARQQLDFAETKFKKLIIEESELQGEYEFTQARKQAKDHELKALQTALLRQESNRETDELLQEFLNEACAFDIDSDI